jgi:hypothetical protein
LFFEKEIHFCCVIFCVCQPTNCTVVQREHTEQEAPVTAGVVGEDFKSARVLFRITVSSGIHCPTAMDVGSTSKGASFFDAFWLLDAFLGLGPV